MLWLHLGHSNCALGFSCVSLIFPGNQKQIIPKHKNITVQNKKDFQWLGASVDVNYDGNEDVVVSGLCLFVSSFFVCVCVCLCVCVCVYFVNASVSFIYCLHSPPDITTLVDWA